MSADLIKRFAGHFVEQKSGMSYRLWEQVGHEPTADSVELFEGEQPDRIATLERENAELKGQLGAMNILLDLAANALARDAKLNAVESGK